EDEISKIVHGCVVLIDRAVVFRRRTSQGAKTVRPVRFNRLSPGRGGIKQNLGALQLLLGRLHFSDEASLSRVFGTVLRAHYIPLSAEALASIRRSFAMLSTPGLQTAYQEAWERCRLGLEGKPPCAECIQELVQV